MNTMLNPTLNACGAKSSGARSLKVQVIATSFGGTRAALAAAQKLAAGLVARVVVFVPHVVPYGEPLDHPTIKPELIGARYGRLAEEMSFEVDVRVCVCRSWAEALGSVLSLDAPIVVGGDARRWFPTREQNLAASLVTMGYEVLFVGPVKRGGPVSASTGHDAMALSRTATARR
jgi:hypothetical protein